MDRIKYAPCQHTHAHASSRLAPHNAGEHAGPGWWHELLTCTLGVARCKLLQQNTEECIRLCTVVLCEANEAAEQRNIRTAAYTCRGQVPVELVRSLLLSVSFEPAMLSYMSAWPAQRGLQLWHHTHMQAYLASFEAQLAVDDFQSAIGNGATEANAQLELGRASGTPVTNADSC
jgi:hypothetical protein